MNNGTGTGPGFAKKNRDRDFTIKNPGLEIPGMQKIPGMLNFPVHRERQQTGN